MWWKWVSSLGVGGLVGILALSAVSWAADDVPLDEPLGPMPLVPTDPPAEPTWTRQQLDAWVERLGDESFAVRQQATQTLVDASLDALEPLRARLDDTDAERRRRVRRILTTVLEAKHWNDLERFTAGQIDGEHLAGWTWFRTVAGDTPNSRKLFALMQTEEAGLLAAAGAGSDEAEKALRLRYWQIMQGMRNVAGRPRQEPQLATLAALTLVLTHPELELSKSLAENNAWASLWQRATSTSMLREGEFVEPLRRLVNVWLIQPGEANLQTVKFRMALSANLEGGLILGDQILADKKATPMLRVYAAELIARVGGKEHAARLLPMLDDETVVATQRMNNVDYEIQVRDAALAWLVYVTEQELGQYDLERAKSWFERLEKYPQQAFYFRVFGYANAEARDKAFGKLQEYLDESPLGEAAELPEFVADPPRRKADPPGGAVQLGLAPQRVGGAPRVQVRGQAKDEDEAENETEAEGHFEVDRIQGRRLSQAQRLLDEGLFGDAVRLLEAILSSPHPGALRDDLGVPLYRCLRTEAGRVLRSLPADAREAYQLQFAEDAASALSRAVTRSDTQALEAVAKRYPGLPAADEAVYRLAVMAHDSGQHGRAAERFGRLRATGPWAERFEPALSLQWAHSLWRLGRVDQAEQVLRDLRDRHGRRELRLQGQPMAWFDAEDPRAWMTEWAGPAGERPERARWPLFRGEPTRNRSEPADVPYLRPLVAAPLNNRAILREAIDFTEKAHREHRRAVLPVGYPLVLDQAVVVRTPLGLEAHRWPEGDLLWTSEDDSDLAALLAHDDEHIASMDLSSLGDSLRQRLWKDVAASRLSSDGQRVFVVEGQSFAIGPSYQRTGLTPEGRRTLASGPTDVTNRLAAYHADNGKLLWETEAPEDGVFLSVPLPLNEELLAIVQVNSQATLVRLDPRTGEVTDSTPLAISQPSVKPDARAQAIMLARMNQLGRMPTVDVPNAPGPSYADGVLVCPTGPDRFVAIDTLDGTPLWMYYYEPDGLTNLAGGASDSWVENSVILAHGRALLCPAGSEEMLCLDLRSGRLLWTAPRHDGLYVGGVGPARQADQLGTVLVVGRNSVRGLQLADGQAAWEALPLPAGSWPSGQGSMAGDRYLLPLASGEIAAVGLATGNFLARTRSPDGTVPGNLVGLGNRTLSQSPTQLVVFESLDARRRLLTKAAADGEPKALADLAEVLLYQGEIEAALKRLLAASEKAAPPRTLALLAEAAAQGLELDYHRFADTVERDVLERLSSDTDRRRVLGALLTSARGAEQMDTAITALLGLMKLAPAQGELVEATEGRQVQPESLWQAKLSAVRRQASDVQRERLDQAVEQWFTQAADEQALAAALSVAGTHPSSSLARVRLIDKLLEKRNYFEAEQVVHQLLAHGGPEQAPDALALLGELRRRASRPESAVPVFRELLTHHADAPLREGLTGGQLVERLPPAGPVRQLLAGEGDWADLPIWSKTEGQSQNFEQSFPLVLATAADRWTPSPWVRTDARLLKLWIDDPSGKEPTEISLPSDGQTRYFSSVGYAGRVASCGHLTVVWLGHGVFAFNTMDSKPKRLWHLPTSRPDPLNADNAANKARVAAVRRRMMPGQNPAALTSNLVVTSEAVIFQQDDRLLAVHPLTGKPLWIRDGLPDDCDLLGDENLVLVTPPNANRALALDPRDGHARGERAVPAPADRVYLAGTRVVTWTGADGKRQLAQVDLSDGTTLWQHEFPEATEMTVASNGEAALLDPEGRLTLLVLDEGTIKATSELPKMDDRQDLVLLPRLDHWVLVVNQADRDQDIRVTTPNTPWNRRVHGQVFGIDRAKGSILWQTAVQHQSLDVTQPAELPVLILASRMYKQQRRDNGSITMRMLGTRYLCLETRSGVAAFDETFSEHNEAYTLKLEPKAGQIDVITRSRKISLRLSETSPGDDFARHEPAEDMAEDVTDDDEK